MAAQNELFLPKYLLDQSGLASFDGGWLDCSRIGSLAFNVWWSAFAATAGTLSVGTSNDHTLGQLINPAAGSITALTLTAPTGGNATGVHGNAGSLSVAASASQVQIVIWPLPRLVRLSYTRSAGGTTSQFQCAVTGRGI